MIKWLKGLFKEEPAFHFTLMRVTSQDEQITIQFNGKASESQEELQARVNMVGDLVYHRMLHQNEVAIAIEKKIKEQANQAQLAVYGGQKGCV